MSLFTKKIGIDLGTVNTLVFIPKRGIILNEPTVIALSSDAKTVLAVGTEAQIMLGRTPENIIAILSDANLDLAKMGAAAGKFARRDAAKEMADIILKS